MEPLITKDQAAPKFATDASEVPTLDDTTDGVKL